MGNSFSFQSTSDFMWDCVRGQIVVFFLLKCVTEEKMLWPWMCLCLWFCAVEPVGCPVLTHCLIRKTLRAPTTPPLHRFTQSHSKEGINH